jgi:acetate kinase
MPLQKYGFHGLSYASIVDSVAQYLKKPADQVDIVVAHLGSGASAACIQGGKSIDTSTSSQILANMTTLTYRYGLDTLGGFDRRDEVWND